ncbi:MAG: Holliday junction resolvase RuvX [Pseudomonadales bacterium]|jgi:putative Holliday junction resolvase|nr:Holliday junction resolvase RuvX [Pseudomonadales bacterium]
MADAPDRDHRSAMAFDFGLRRIGTAVGQTLTGTARPTANLSARDGVPDWTQVERLLAEWRPDVLVVGLPLNMDGTESEMSRRARRFGNRLAARTRRPVAFQDERLSSREASDRARPGTHRDDLHGEAACVILEDWLGAERSGGER